MKIQFHDLKEKTVLVTGATRGIGRGIALKLAEEKAHVVFNFREESRDRMESLQNDLLDAGATKATPLLFDVTNSEQMKNAVGSFLKEGNIVHGLVNNAGMAKDQLILRLKEEDLEQMLAVNLKSAILLSQVLSRNFLKSSGSSIVNISSIVGLMGNPGQTSYAVSKAGLIGLTKSLAKEMGGKNVRCNAVCPGFIKTDMTKDINKEAYMENIPLKKIGEVENVADLVCFLLSDASSYITGEVIKIDGGLYI